MPIHMKTKLTLTVLAAILVMLGVNNAGAAIALRSLAATNTTTSTSLVINLTTSVMQGDVLLANIAQDGSYNAVSAPTGWILIGSTNSTGSGSTARAGAVFYKVASSSEPTSYTFMLASGTTHGAGAIVAFSGVNTNAVGLNPFDAPFVGLFVESNDVKSVQATSITNVSANAAVIMLSFSPDENHTWTGWTTTNTNPSGLTRLYNYNTADNSVAAAWTNKPTAGPTGNGTATLDSNGRNGSILLALRPLLPATKVVFTTQPASTNAGSTMASVVAQLEDSNGNPVPSSGVSISLALSANSFASGTASAPTDSTGKATFSSLVIDTAATNYTITATSSGLTSGQSTSFSITAATASKLVITSAAVSTAAGVASTSITVQVQDQYGNPVTTGTTSVVLSSSSTVTATFNPASSLSIGSGSSTATFTYTDTKAGTPTITAASTGLTSGTQQETVTAGAASATNSAISASPASITANGTSTSTVTVTEKDAYGNSLTASGTTPVLSTSAGALGSVVNNNNGTYTVMLTSSTVAGTANITGTIGGTAIGASANVVFTPGAAAKLVFTTQPATTMAGSAINPPVVVKVEDANGNTITGFTGSVTISSVTTGFSGGTLSVNAVAGVATFSAINPTTAGSANTLYVNGDSLPQVTSGTFTVNAAAVNAGQSTVTASPGSVTADGTTTSTVTVTLKDAYGNPVSGKAVSLTQQSGTGTPTISTASGASSASGVVTFTVKSVTAGTDVFAATDTTDSNLAITQTANVVFTPGAAAKLVFTTQPATTTAGSAINPPVVVKVEDANGNVVTTDNSSVTISSSTTGFTGSTLTVAAVNGVATFSAVNPTTAGTANTLMAGDGSLAGATSNPFTVTAGALDHFAISTIASPQTVGIAITGVTLTAQDAYNNTVTSFTSTVAYGGTAGITGTSGSFTSGVLSGVSVTPTVAGNSETFTVTGSGKSGTSTFNVGKATPGFSGLTASQSTTYGATSVTLAGKVSAVGGIYPALGETVTVTINGIAQTTTINDSTGDFSISYNPSAIPASATPYTITCSYAGDANLNGATDTSKSLTVNKASSTVTVTGTTSFTYTGMAQGPNTSTVTGSGGAVTYTYVGTGSTTYAASSTPPTAAGTYSVTATVVADSNYNGASSSATAFTIAKATPTVTVTGTTSFTYNGSPQGPASATVSPTDTGTVTWRYVGTGGTSYGPSATPPTGAGSYTATASVTSDGNNNAASSSATAFTIGKVNTTTGVATSGSPVLPTANVTFTATVSAGGPVPTGTVQFQSNGTNLGTVVTVNGSGQAQVTVLGSAVGHGYDVVTAIYVNADGNFNGSTGTLSPNQVVDTPPKKNTHFMGTIINTNLVITASALLALDSDADGDPLTITGVSSTSTNGPAGNVTFNGTTITFAPMSNYAGLDLFTYTISDGYPGGTVTNTIVVTISVLTANFYAITPVNQTVNLLGYGRPGYLYLVQESGDMQVWNTIGQTNAFPNGLVLFTDVNATNSPRYYRLAKP